MAIVKRQRRAGVESTRFRRAVPTPDRAVIPHESRGVRVVCDSAFRRGLQSKGNLENAHLPYFQAQGWLETLGGTSWAARELALGRGLPPRIAPVDQRPADQANRRARPGDPQIPANRRLVAGWDLVRAQLANGPRHHGAGTPPRHRGASSGLGRFGAHRRGTCAEFDAATRSEGDTSSLYNFLRRENASRTERIERSRSSSRTPASPSLSS
jgi:hypothetical protein